MIISIHSPTYPSFPSTSINSTFFLGFGPNPPAFLSLDSDSRQAWGTYRMLRIKLELAVRNVNALPTVLCLWSPNSTFLTLPFMSFLLIFLFWWCYINGTGVGGMLVQWVEHSLCMWLTQDHLLHPIWFPTFPGVTPTLTHHRVWPPNKTNLNKNKWEEQS